MHNTPPPLQMPSARLSSRTRSPILLLLPLISLLVLVLVQHKHLVSAQETELELLEIESRIKKQIEEAVTEIEELRTSNERLKEEQIEIETAMKIGKEAKTKRAVKLSNDQNLLEGMKREMGEKQATAMKLNAHITDLKTEIADMDAKLSDLLKSHSQTQSKFLEPSLTDVLDYKAQSWNVVPRVVYSNTVNKILPAVTEMSNQARFMREKYTTKSKFLAILATLVIYGFVIGVFLTVNLIYKKIKGNLTIAKVLFIGDAICACFWYIIILLYMLLWRDPLAIIRSRNELLFLAFQILAFFCYVFYVLLRVLMLAATLTPGALGEVLCVIVVGHHYYVRVWEPAMTDHQVHGTLFYYFCYSWLFSAFAFSRIQELAPLKQLRGTKLPLLTWIQVLKSRFTRADVPDGDIDSSDSDSSDSESNSDST